jgi:hypothetical protein
MSFYGAPRSRRTSIPRSYDTTYKMSWVIQ